MSEEGLNQKSFDAFDEQDLALIMNQVARRMLILRPNTPDIGFWHGTIVKVIKFLNATPTLNQEEKDLIINTNGKGRVKAIRQMRERTSMRLAACHKIVLDWIAKNLPEKTNDK